MGKLTEGVVGVFGCHGAGGNQEWSFTRAGQVKHADLCLTLEEAKEGTRLKLKMCNNALMQVRVMATVRMQKGQMILF